MQNSQQKAIEKVEGPCIILAGAGTGKTYTIVEKIKYIINNRIYDPEKIVCLTFSNEAALSMRTRILRIVNEQEPIIKTFHSFCAELLRKYGKKIGISEDFKIILPDDIKIIFRKNFRISPIHCHLYVGAIGTAKDLGIKIEDFDSYLSKKSLPEDDELEKQIDELRFRSQIMHLDKSKKEELNVLKERIFKLAEFLGRRKFVKLWKAYEKIKEKRNSLDYSDLNKHALSLINEFPEITKEFEYVIVDEFQDTNKLQCDFLEKFALKKNITVVGDLNQSIYRFRGAYKDNLANFKKAFNVNNDDIFALDKSFRSTNRILKAANKLILNNYKNREDECFSVFNAFEEEGEKIEAFELNNSREEARKIVEAIKNESVPLEEICVLFRTHQQSKILKSALENEKIPYTSAKKNSLIDVAAIKIVIGVIEILDKIKNKAKGGEQAWWDIIYNMEFSKEDAIAIGKFIKRNKENECLSLEIINSFYAEKLSEAGRMKVEILTSRLKKLAGIEKPVPELILEIYEIFGLNPSDENEKDKILILQRFYDFAREFSEIESSDVSGFLYHIEIIRMLGIEIESPSLESSGVRIMTHHATKGLEYNTVIVSNLVQRRFPMEKIEKSLIPSELSPELASLISGLPEYEMENIIREHEIKNQLMEERRLCYVAFTRAKKKLILTFAKEYGNRKFFPSQFLNEINYGDNSDIDFVIDTNEKYGKFEKNRKLDLDSGNDGKAFVPENIVFSPSSLQLFSECRKRYEYKYIYNMPDPRPISWDAIKLGSFAHLVLEKGVKLKFKTEKDFLDLAKTLQMQDEWNFIDLKEVFPLIKVFFYRNKDKYDERSLTEKELIANIDGLKFFGKADRIDFYEDGLSIVDYKTGNIDIKPKYRNWQLGFYAIAASELGKPRRIILDMLKKEVPIEFVLDNNGNAREVHSARTFFNLNEVRKEIVETAREIMLCYKKGFSPCEIDKSCSFCNEYFWKV